MNLSFSEYILTKISDSIERSWDELLDPGPSSLARSHQIEHERIREEREKEKKKRKLYYTLYYLNRSKFIEEITKGEDKKFRLTPKGMLKIFKIKNKLIEKKGLIEKKSLLVIFDIPEVKKKDRDFFRRGLILLGFEKKQLSVWFSPYNLLKEVKEWTKFCKLEDCVEYFFVQEI